MIRVIIADDEPLIRFALRTLLSATEDIEVVGEACDGTEAVAQARALAPDLVITDLRMPGMNGIEATKRLLALPNPPSVLVLTTFDAYDGVMDALNAGASGYLLKDAPPEQVTGAVRVVAVGGGTVLAKSLTTQLVGSGWRQGSRDSRLTGEQRRRLDGLTEQQHELLIQLGRGLSNAQIAQELYLTEGTVKTYVSRLLSLLKLENRTQAAILAHVAGFLEPPDGPTAGT
ncbi:response regulator [Streptomyces sp. NPDC059443]|uniref:response regulator n=1 Tax=unclassified Streptomyces TaxID=2593676 RepID=UPI00369FA394